MKQQDSFLCICSSSPVAAMLTVALALLTLFWPGVECYSKGAPFSTCLTMFPKHGPTQRKFEPSPFRLELRPSSYGPGEIITVAILSANRPFKGIQVKAVRSQGDSESVLGTFVKTPANITQVFTCEGGFKNMVTHTQAMSQSDTREITLTWKAPDTNVGNIMFVASVVENFETFWTGVTAALASEHPARAKPSANWQPVIKADTSVDMLQLDLCGQDRGCFLYPRFCSGPEDCKAAVTYRREGSSSGSANVDLDIDGEDDFFHFDMMARDADYVSVGFSHDDKMGEDETVSCTADDQILTVQHGFNPKLYNQRIVRHQLSDLHVNRTDGNIACSFRRPRVTVTRYINQSAPELQYVSSTYDLNNDYYLMLAWGTVKNGSDVMKKHKELPPVTDSKVSFKNYAIYRGSVFSVETRIHGSVMAVAWVLVAGLTTAISRYYKHWLSNRVFCGTSIWFQIHRAAAITVGVLTGSAVILMIIKIGGFAEEYKHAILGFVVVSLVGIQNLAGFLRPERASRYRSLFKWTHMILGLSSHILSAVTMYLALDIRYMPAVMREFGVTVLTGWVPLQIGWTIVLELRRCCTVQLGVKKEKEPWWEVVKSPDTLLLIFYLLTLLMLTAATVSTVLVF